MDKDKILSILPRPNWGYAYEKFKSNTNEDEIFVNLLKGKKQGLIVDIGAADGVTGSNSFKLINEYAFSSIMLEAMDYFYDFLKILYKENEKVKIFHCAVTEHEDLEYINLYYENKVFVQERSGLSSTLPIFSDFKVVRTCFLNNILSSCNVNKIDVLSIDIEGKDFAILKTIDYEKYKISIICLEKVNNFLELSEFLKEKNFIFYCQTDHNLIFINNENLNEK